MKPKSRQSKSQQASSRLRRDTDERIDEKRPTGANQTEEEPTGEKRRSLIATVGIAVAILAAIISAVSAYISIRSYQSQQDASKQAMADQVVVAAPPMSPAQLDQLKNQHPLDFYNYLPIYVQNYGRLPVLGVVAKATVNGKIEVSQLIGTLLPCTQVEIDGILRSAMSRGHGREQWTVIVRFEDVAGQTWERSVAGSPWPVESQGFVFQEGVGIATTRVNDCTAA